MHTYQRDTCIDQLKGIFHKEAMEECEEFIKIKREFRHLRTLECQKSKFERLCHKNTGCHSNIQQGKYECGCSNHNLPPNVASDPNSSSKSNNNTWVRNISKTPLTEAQEQLLAHGPNFAVVPRYLAIGKYVAAVEKVCQQLKQGDVEGLQGKVKIILKKAQPPKSNISKEEAKALKELKNDKTRMILTADKGVSKVVMDREEYINEAEELFSELT